MRLTRDVLCVKYPHESNGKHEPVLDSTRRSQQLDALSHSVGEVEVEERRIGVW